MGVEKVVGGQRRIVDVVVGVRVQWWAHIRGLSGIDVGTGDGVGGRRFGLTSTATLLRLFARAVYERGILH